MPSESSSLLIVLKIHQGVGVLSFRSHLSPLAQGPCPKSHSQGPHAVFLPMTVVRYPPQQRKFSLPSNTNLLYAADL